MDRNEELAESLKKHEYEHRELAEILMNAEARTEGIDISLKLILLSFQSYLYWEDKKTRPRWELVNEEACSAEDDNSKGMDSFLDANPLPDDMKGFKNILNDPNAVWKEIDGEKGGVQ